MPLAHENEKASVSLETRRTQGGVLDCGRPGHWLSHTDSRRDCRASTPDCSLSTSATVERIRHWTRENLLSPVNQHHAGTGRHRRYAEQSVYDSAVLIALANAGLTVVSQSYLSRALPLARDALQKWLKGKSKAQDLPLFLVISRNVNKQAAIKLSVHECVVKQSPNAEISLTINLSRIFDRVLAP